MPLPPIAPHATHQLTEDDSWLNDAMRSGIAPEAALHDPNAHAITQCLGMRDDVPEIHTQQLTLEAGTWLMLCSDGLWNYADGESAMHTLVQNHVAGSAHALTLALVHFANARGGMDNVSIAAVHLPMD
jgi:PPM family protein phosphatase